MMTRRRQVYSEEQIAPDDLERKAKKLREAVGPFKSTFSLSGSMTARPVPPPCAPSTRTWPRPATPISVRAASPWCTPPVCSLSTTSTRQRPASGGCPLRSMAYGTTRTARCAAATSPIPAISLPHPRILALAVIDVGPDAEIADVFPIQCCLQSAPQSETAVAGEEVPAASGSLISTLPAC